MASSKLMMNMSSSTCRNSDLLRRKSSNSSSSSTSTNQNQNQNQNQNHNHNHNHHHHHPGPPIPTNNNSGMTVEGNNQQPLPTTQITLLDAAGAVTPINAAHTPATQQTAHTSSKSGDDVWKEFVAGRSCKQEVPDEMMTLEDFLAKAGAVEEEDVKIPPPPLPTGGIFSYDIHQPNANVDGFGIGVEEMGGRGKRRAILETLDKAAQQRQRRMIKNRESAARSRERKQAYQAELESLAVKLEEENEALLKVKTEQTRKRYKQLMENIIPVTEKQRPTKCVLRKVRSMEW